MSQIDWRALSGPRVSRRTLMQLAAASGTAGFASYLNSRQTLLEGVRSARAASQDEPQQGGNLRLGFLISQIVTLDPQQL